MSDNDLMSDSLELRELRDAFSGVAVPERPGLDAITARGRARRRRRRSDVARLSVLGVLAATAIVVAQTGVHGRASTLGTIRTVSFTIHKNANGTTTLTINPKELLDPTALQNDLAKYGIPAKVTVGNFCSSDPAPAGLSQVVSTQPAGQFTTRLGPVAQPTITFDGTAIPAGTELSFGDFQLPNGEQQANFALINTSSYTCTSTPPTLGPDTPGVSGLLYGPRPAGS
jgi:hypothetical protein